MSGLLDLLLGPLGGILAAAVGALALFLTGRSKGRSEARREAEKSRADTLERMHDADTGHGDSAEQSREWLRERGKR